MHIFLNHFVFQAKFPKLKKGKENVNCQNIVRVGKKGYCGLMIKQRSLQYYFLRIL